MTSNLFRAFACIAVLTCETPSDNSIESVYDFLAIAVAFTSEIPPGFSSLSTKITGDLKLLEIINLLQDLPFLSGSFLSFRN